MEGLTKIGLRDTNSRREFPSPLRREDPVAFRGQRARLLFVHVKPTP